MKTVIIYDDLESNLRYAIVDGDYSRFHDLHINAGNAEPELESEACDFLFAEEGEFKIDFSDDKSLLENKEWDKVAIITFLP